jgi:transposase-like protein
VLERSTVVVIGAGRSEVGCDNSERKRLLHVKPRMDVPRKFACTFYGEYIGECLSCLAFPERHRRPIRTTNGLKYLNQEIKRRTRVIRIFPNRAACLRLVTALTIEQSEEWVTRKR